MEDGTECKEHFDTRSMRDIHKREMSHVKKKK